MNKTTPAGLTEKPIASNIVAKDLTVDKLKIKNK